MEKLEIHPPEGYEIDKDRSDLKKGTVYFKEVKKKLTYKDVAQELFQDKKTYYLEQNSSIGWYNGTSALIYDANNSVTRKQLESILALNKLCNVAKYLNGDWLPEIGHNLFYIFYDCVNDNFKINASIDIKANIYFKSIEVAQQAIEILGEDEIIKALTLNH